MKILYHSVPPTRYTGYGVHTRFLLERMKEDHDVDILSIIFELPEEEREWEGIDVYGPNRRDDAGISDIQWRHHINNYDSIISHCDHWSHPESLSNLHDVPLFLYTILDTEKEGKIPASDVVEATSSAKRVIAMSEWAENRLYNSSVPDEKIQQIPHGVDTDLYSPAETIRERLGISEDVFLFGFVGANRGSRKNVPEMLDAFSNVVDEYDCRFYLHTKKKFWRGENLEEHRNEAGLDEDVCIFRDEVLDGKLPEWEMPSLYSSFDVLVNCSQSESWGLTITESMSCETPVIVSNFSAMTEQLGVDPEYVVSGSFEETDCGLLVNRGEQYWPARTDSYRYIAQSSDIESAMRYYLDNPNLLSEHGKRARERVVENYDWDTIYEEYWDKLLHEAPSRTAHLA